MLWELIAKKLMTFSKIALPIELSLIFSTVTFSSGIQDKKESSSEPPAISYSQAPLNQQLPQHGVCGDKPLPPNPVDESKFIRVGGSVMSQNLVHQEIPVYPREAKDKHIKGTVILRAIITPDGKVTKIQFLSGPSELKKSAIDAVEQWRYKPVCLNGEPINVDTTISISYPWKAH
jgi:TonB family protein